MVEKKTVVIAVLCVIMVLSLGALANSGQEVRTLEGELEALRDIYDSLNEEHSKIVDDYDNLKTVNQGIAEEKTRILEDYTTIETKYNSLNDQFSATILSHINLQNRLNSILEEGEAIAESAEWISEDERLKVTSDLIKSGTSYWETHTVRATITNIGDEPIDKVVIFVFPYKDGKFAETYSGYESHSVESIYIGETYSHDFRIYSEMTSYKVLAVAG